MLFSLGHGQTIVTGNAEPAVHEHPIQADERDDTTPIEAVGVSEAITERMRSPAGPNLAIGGGAPAPAPVGGPFRYYFPNTPSAQASPDAATRLDALADSMLAAPPAGTEQNSTVPPVYTYLGQFIDHDITANTDRETSLSVIEGNIDPLSRGTVTQGLLNLRVGSLGLDSLYGDEPGQTGFAFRLSKLMRHPTLRSKMFVGMTTDTDGNRPPLPADPATDLLRLGRLMDPALPDHVTQAELDALPAELKGNFVDDVGQPRKTVAIIGDGRNDENLIVAQLHVAFLRLHNKIVDYCHETHAATGVDAVFEWARQRTRWHYQWLVVNDYLPHVCDPAVVAEVKQRAAPLYKAFFQANPPPNPEHLPLPLEFSVAAFRFGHSMVRGAYDHNRFFGVPEDGSPTIINPPGFNLFFTFTGRGVPPFNGFAETLPDNWIIEWKRFVSFAAAFPNRSARKIDTHLSPPLDNMQKEAAGVFKHLAKRNLRRGHRLNIPSAQDIIYALAPTYQVTPLTEAQLKSGATGVALETNNFLQNTPLWFYVLKEAEEGAGKGNHLGKLGSILVAETLIGLVINDPSSYWNQPGSDNGRWSPADGAKPGGITIDSIPNMMKAAAIL
jgi:hypothetical protein